MIVVIEESVVETVSPFSPYLHEDSDLALPFNEVDGDGEHLLPYEYLEMKGRALGDEILKHFALGGPDREVTKAECRAIARAIQIAMTGLDRMRAGLLFQAEDTVSMPVTLKRWLSEETSDGKSGEA
jgi:hypothetical protein